MPRNDTIHWGKRVAALEERLAEARANRDAAIRDALTSGRPVHVVAEEAGLSRQQVFNIASVNRLDSR